MDDEIIHFIAKTNEWSKWKKIRRIIYDDSKEIFGLLSACVVEAASCSEHAPRKTE